MDLPVLDLEVVAHFMWVQLEHLQPIEAELEGEGLQPGHCMRWDPWGASSLKGSGVFPGMGKHRESVVHVSLSLCPATELVVQL